jgi:hypothetical protein
MRDRHRPLRVGKKLRASRRIVLDVTGGNRQCDRTAQARVACAKHLAEPALAETFENPVVPDGLQDAAIILAACLASDEEAEN